MQPSAQTLSKLLLTLYAAPARPELWHAFLREFSGILGVAGAAILHQDLVRKRYGFSATFGIDPVAEQEYSQHFGQVDPFRPKFLMKQEGELAFAEDLCPSTLLKKTELYGDYLSRYGFTLFCAMATIKQPATCEFISIYRGLHGKQPRPEVLATIELITPHIRNALQLRQHLCGIDVSAANYAATLNSLNVGVVLINQNRECVFVNPKAEAICTSRIGLSISQSRLTASALAENQILCNLIDSALGLAQGRIARSCRTMSISRLGRASLRLSAIPLSPHAPLFQFATPQMAVAAIFISDSEDEAISLPKILIATFKLTPAETRLATQVFRGYSLAEAAKANSVSIETVRVQLKSIFAKTRVSRQTDLLRLMGETLKRASI